MKLLKKNYIIGLGLFFSTLLISTPSYALFGGGGCDICKRWDFVNNFVSSGISSLQSQLKTPGGLNAMYAIVGRSNDIFTFCREGVPLDGWIGVDPGKGQFQILNPYGNPQWIPYYAVICPFGVNQAVNPLGGMWQGPPTGANFKADPSSVVPLIPFPH